MSQSFEMLLAEFASAKGLAADPGAYALEFESDGHSVSLLPHPLHADRVLVEVSVAELGQDGLAVDLAPLLLQINEVSRFEHDWLIVMDGQMQVSISTVEPMLGLGVSELESLMLEGLERAQALLKFLEVQAQRALEGQTDAPQELSDVAGASTMLRG